MMRRLAVVVAFATASALCADWNPKLAANYLDASQKEWFTWRAAAMPDGPCVSCHTGVTYLLARPALRRALGESEATAYETGLLAGLRARVPKTHVKDVFPAELKGDLASQAVGVEAIVAAWAVGTKPAFDRMWSLQSREGPTKGAWPWFSLELDPWEMPESVFFGAAMAALAVGASPDQPKERTADLAAYLAREQASQPLHNRLMLLWAASKWPDALAEAARRPILAEAWKKQQEDGGWTMQDLGPWKEHPNAPPSNGSNSYATALAVFTLEQAGVPRSDVRLARALGWLRSHQNRETGAWPAESMNKRYEPGSRQSRFMQDAATAFAVLALVE